MQSFTRRKTYRSALGESRPPYAALETQKTARARPTWPTRSPGAAAQRYDGRRRARPRARGHVLRAAEHDNVFAWRSRPRCSMAIAPDAAPTSDRVAVSRTGACSTSEWQKGSTTPSRSSTISTPAPPDSGDRLVSTCMPKCSTESQTDLERIDRSQPALFTVEYAPRWSTLRRARRGVHRIQHRRIHRAATPPRIRPADSDQKR